MDIFINLYKDKGISSNNALTQVKKFFKVKKAGHAGTLDPLAEGVLIIGLNKATKIFPYLADLTKEYIFTAHLGITTDSYDSEGNIIGQKDASFVSEKMVIDILPFFTGKISQKPPIYSALKHKGKPLYDYARKGIAIEIKERTVRIYKINLLSFELPFATFLVECSTGTYVRSLCHDIGMKLGVGAHATELKRTRIGHFTLKNTVMIDELPKTSKGIFNIDKALSHMPYIVLSKESIDSLRHGKTIHLNKIQQNQWEGINSYVKILDERSEIFAIGYVKEEVLKVKRVLEF